MANPLVEVTREYLAEKNNWDMHDGKEPLWEYARAVLAETLDREGWRIDPETVLEWAGEALEILGTDWCEFNGIEDNDEGRSEFFMVYQRVKCPAGMSPLDLACGRAKEAPMNFQHKFPSKPFGHFLDMLFYLQDYAGKNPIAIPVQEVAQVLGTTRKTVSNWRKIAQMEGYLNKASGAVPNVKAATFFFHQKD